MRIVEIVAKFETDQLTHGPLLETVIRTALEKVFFLPTNIISITVNEYENTAVSQETDKS